MQALSTDDGTYIRSMATRGQMGGLAPATRDVAMVLDAAGCDVVFVETVGVGQDEVDVARLADATVVLAGWGARAAPAGAWMAGANRRSPAS